jgi:hypothetical protein
MPRRVSRPRPSVSSAPSLAPAPPRRPPHVCRQPHGARTRAQAGAVSRSRSVHGLQVANPDYIPSFGFVLLLTTAPAPTLATPWLTCKSLPTTIPSTLAPAPPPCRCCPPPPRHALAQPTAGTRINPPSGGTR